MWSEKQKEQTKSERKMKGNDWRIQKTRRIKSGE